jgi:DNA-binding transcriptional MerR regulator
MLQKAVRFSIGDLARRSGVGVATIRYYGEIGLLPPAGRGPGGHRFYGESHLKRLQFIRRSRELGFSQDDVRALLTYSDQRSAPCAEVDQMARAQLAGVREKIASLRCLEEALEGMISACRGQIVEECSIIDALSRQAGAENQNRLPTSTSAPGRD